MLNTSANNSGAKNYNPSFKGNTLKKVFLNSNVKKLEKNLLGDIFHKPTIVENTDVITDAAAKLRLKKRNDTVFKKLQQVTDFVLDLCKQKNATATNPDKLFNNVVKLAQMNSKYAKDNETKLLLTEAEKLQSHVTLSLDNVKNFINVKDLKLGFLKKDGANIKVLQEKISEFSVFLSDKVERAKRLFPQNESNSVVKSFERNVREDYVFQLQSKTNRLIYGKNPEYAEAIIRRDLKQKAKSAYELSLSMTQHNGLNKLRGTYVEAERFRLIRDKLTDAKKSKP